MVKNKFPYISFIFLHFVLKFSGGNIVKCGIETCHINYKKKKKKAIGMWLCLVNAQGVLLLWLPFLRHLQASSLLISFINLEVRLFLLVCIVCNKFFDTPFENGNDIFKNLPFLYEWIKPRLRKSKIIMPLHLKNRDLILSSIQR